MQNDTVECDALRSFSRPRYFYGQLLDVRHFESEQAYFKRKHWMRNRLVDGFGVICGLDVVVGADGQSVVVQPGVALDKQGREIVVPARTKALPIPRAQDDGVLPDGVERLNAGTATQGTQRSAGGHCDGEWVRLVICYDECKSDPEPVMGGGCESTRCSPGAIREGYSLALLPGQAEPIATDSGIERVIKNGNVDYYALVQWVSAPCDCDSGPGCITLANIRLPAAGEALTLSNIDIAVRPIVYSLDLLWELVLALSHDTPSRRNGKN